MSQSDVAADRRAAEAVVRHHTELATTLAEHVTQLVRAADAGTLRQAWQRRDQLVAWLNEELLPHASAEEATLYPAAAALSGGGPLIKGMQAEHRTITALATELARVASPLAAAAAARALQALVEVHVTKENDLVVPLLVEADEVSLADLLDGMHAIVGGHGQPASEGHGQRAAGGCGGAGGSCGCGGDAANAASAPAPVLTIDPRLDVRDVPHGERHNRVLTALDALPEDGALVLVAPHAPRPLLAEIDARYAGQVTAEWLQDGPDVWQIRLHRLPARA